MTPARLAAILTACALAAMPRAAFAALPEWARSAVETAPPAPDGLSEWPERTLLAETSISVSPDGATWRITRRKVVQVLSARVEPTSFGLFAFDDTTKIKKSKGWHLPPGEHARRDYGGALDLTLPSEFLTDAKTRIVSLEGVKKGSLLAYEFQAESHPYTLTAMEEFFDNVPVSVARWSIELPVGWTLKYTWLTDDGPAPTVTGTTWVFELHDLVPQRAEPMGESPLVLAPRLVVALQPPAGVSPPTPAFSGWGAMGGWYEELARGRETATPEIRAATKDVLAKSGAAPLDRIRAVTLFVRDRVRYLAREVGVGGYQPHRASQVLSELYGDCKDKGTLLRAALQAAGFDAYPMLIHATNPYTVAPTVPAPGSFDHFVVGAVWPKDAAYPDEAASSRVDAGELGTLLVLDPTDERAWPGTLPDNLAGKTAFVVAGGHGVLLTLPEGEPKWHRIVRNANVTLAEDRSVKVQLVSRMYGGPAESARRANARSFKDRGERVEEGLRGTWPGVVVNDYEVTPEDADGAYVETIAFVLPANSPALQESVYWMFAGVTGDIEHVALGKRKSAVQYPYPFELRYDVAITGVATSFHLPDPVKLSGVAWSVESAFRREGDAIRGSFTADLLHTRFEPAAFSDLKQFWAAASKAAAPGISLAR